MANTVKAFNTLKSLCKDVFLLKVWKKGSRASCAPAPKLTFAIKSGMVKMINKISDSAPTPRDIPIRRSLTRPRTLEDKSPFPYVRTFDRTVLDMSLIVNLGWA